MRTRNIFLFLGIFLFILCGSVSILSGYDFSYSEMKNEKFKEIYSIYAQVEITSVANNTISPDDFLFRLVEAGHTAIFQWTAVWVASGIGVIQITIEILKKNEKDSFKKIIYGIIYLVLISLMTISVYNILNVMHLQNQWINRLSNETEKAWFYESRSYLSTLIVGHRAHLSLCEYILIFAHFGFLFIFGIVVWMKSILASI